MGALTTEVITRTLEPIQWKRLLVRGLTLGGVKG
jgi:hypothetical protein